MASLKHTATRGAVWNLAQNIASRLLSLIVFAILARMIDRSAFGAVSLALAVTSLAELLVTQGYGEFITQSSDLSKAHLDTAFWLNAAIGLTLSSAIALGAEPLAAALAEPSVASLVRVLSVSLLIRSFTMVPTGLLTRELKFRTLSLRSLVAASIGGVCGIAAAAMGMGVRSLVVQILVGDIAAAAILWRATTWRPGRAFSSSALKQLSHFGLPIFGAGLLSFATRRLDVMVVFGALGMSTLGLYANAQRIYQIANQVLNKSTENVAFSALSRLSDADARRRDAFYKIVEITAAVCFPAYAALAVAARPIVVVLFGPKWLDGAPILAMFALSGIPISLSYIHYSAFKSTARTRVVLIINLILVAVYLPLLIALVGRGAAAAAGAYLASCAAIIPLEVLGLRAALSIALLDYVKVLAGPALAVCLMTIGCFSVARSVTAIPPLLQLVCIGLVGVVGYIAGLRIFARGTFARCLDLVRSVFHKPATAAVE